MGAISTSIDAPASFGSRWFVRTMIVSSLPIIWGAMGSLRLPGAMTVWAIVEWPITHLLPFLHLTRPVEMLGLPSVIPAAFWGALWALFHQRAGSDATIREVARLLVTYRIGCGMMAFAALKLFAADLPASLAHPSVASVYTYFGEGSGDQFFWWWIGTAPTYRLFTGVIELVGAVLMFFRRTATLGAFLNLTALLHIATMMAGYFDGPVYDTIPFGLVVSCTFVLWLDRKRLVDFLIHNRAKVEGPAGLPWRAPRIATALLILQVLYVARATTASVWPMLYPRPVPSRWYFRMPQDGFYRVEHFERRGSAAIDSAAAAADRWRHVVLDRCRAIARTVDNRQVPFYVGAVPGDPQTPDCMSFERKEPVNHEIQRWNDPELGMFSSRSNFTPVTGSYRIYGNRVEVVRQLPGDTIVVRLQRIPDEAFPLYDPRWWRVRAEPRPILAEEEP